MQTKRTPRYADRNEPLLQREAPRLDGLTEGRSPAGSRSLCQPALNTCPNSRLHLQFLPQLACIKESSCIVPVQSVTDQCFTGKDTWIVAYLPTQYQLHRLFNTGWIFMVGVARKGGRKSDYVSSLPPPPLNSLQKSQSDIVDFELNESNRNCSQTHSTFQENKS